VIGSFRARLDLVWILVATVFLALGQFADDLSHAGKPSPIGNEKEKVEPLPSWLATQILPPWASMIILQITSPRPVP
jgi:hypothetical protein